MKQNSFIVPLMLLCVGCASLKSGTEKFFRIARPDSYDIESMPFERTLDARVENGERKTPSVTVRFDGVTLAKAMQLLTDITGVPIVFDALLDDRPVVGSFFDQPLSAVLESLSRRYGMSISEVAGVYYLGEYKRQDSVTAVVRMPPVDREEIEKAVGAVLTEHGKVSAVGSVLWISDRLDTVRKILDDLDEIRKRNERSYVAEVYFVRVKEEDFLKFTADLRFKSIDVFSSGVNLEKLFEMVVDGDAGLGSSMVETRPVLYLSEGRKASFQVGSEIVRDKKTVSENGVIQTVGYDTFSDGLDLTLQLSRVSDERYGIDLKLSVSTFEKQNGNDTVPPKNTSVLTSPGLLMRDGEICFAGMLKRKDSGKIWNLFGIDALRNSDVITIWLRVREVR